MYTYVHMYLCVYVRMNVCMYVCVYVCDVCDTCVCVFVYIYGVWYMVKQAPCCIFMYVRMHICIHVYMYVCMHVRMFVCLYAYMYARSYVCMFVCIYKLRQGESSWCATIDQEGVIYLLPLLPSHPGLGGFFFGLPPLRPLLFSTSPLYIIYIRRSAPALSDTWCFRRRLDYQYGPTLATNHLSPLFPLPLCDLRSVPPALPFASCVLYTARAPSSTFFWLR